MKSTRRKILDMIDDTRRLSKPISFGIIAVSALISVMLYVQVLVGIVSIEFYFPVLPFAFISNLIIMPALLIAGMYKPSMKIPAIIWLHLTMSITLIHFSQIYSPFTPAWSIMILLSSIYYGSAGFTMSSLWLIATSIVYILLFQEEVQPILNYSLLSMLVVAITIFMSYLFVTVIRNAQKKSEELYAAQRSEQLQVNRLNTLLNSISDAVLTLNRYGRVTSQNASAQAFFDTNESLVGREIDRLLSLRDSDGKDIRVRTLIDLIKSTTMRDDLSTEKAGEVMHLSIQMSRIRSTFGTEEDYGVVMIIRDITKQKSLEEEKDEFISVTSHELRTPVAIAEGSLSNFLLMQEHGADKDKLRESAEGAHKQIVYLASMINDLSTLSRAERGIGDVLEAIDVNALLSDLFSRYQAEAETKGLTLNLDMQSNLPQIETSRLYLEEMLQNFVTNSIKYTKKGSVTLGAKLEGQERITFFVSDTGIGISKADVEHIFEKFYRSEDYRTRETSGTGLGLYVVAKLSQKLNTKINVESRLNFGSRFSFSLPLHTLKFGAAGAQPAKIADSASLAVQEPDNEPSDTAQEEASEKESSPKPEKPESAEPQSNEGADDDPERESNDPQETASSDGIAPELIFGHKQNPLYRPDSESEDDFDSDEGLDDDEDDNQQDDDDSQPQKDNEADEDTESSGLSEKALGDDDSDLDSDSEPDAKKD